MQKYAQQYEMNIVSKYNFWGHCGERDIEINSFNFSVSWQMQNKKKKSLLDTMPTTRGVPKRSPI